MNTMDLGIVRIKNVSGEDYELEEMGGVILPDQEELNLLDPEIGGTYNEYEAALRLVTELTTAQLYQDIQAGKVVLLATIPPMGLLG